MAVLKQAHTKKDFLEAFQKRGERLLRAGAFSWGESRNIFSDKFGGAKPLSELEMTQELLQTRFEMIKRSPPTLHEAGFFLRTLSKALSQPDQLSFLDSFSFLKNLSETCGRVLKRFR